MKFISTFLIALLSHGVVAASLSDSVRTYQEALIAHGVTGSNIAGVFEGSEVPEVPTVAPGFVSEVPGLLKFPRFQRFPRFSGQV